LIEIFDVRNALLRFCLTLTPITSMFRSMEDFYSTPYSKTHCMHGPK